MKALIEHLRHRLIYKVGGIYLAVAWLLTQVTVSIEAPLNLPPWADTLVIVMLAIGFPVALLLAWIGEHRRDVVPESAGLPATAHPGDGTSAGRKRGTRGEIRFCTTADGHRLAYSRSGQGIPVVRTGNWLSHAEIEWDLGVTGHILRDFSARFDLINYDGRGTGLSDRGVEAFSLDTMVADMEAVVDANGIDRFAILAFSQSCSVAVAYAARHPERVSHLVVYGGFISNFRPPEEIAAMAALFRQSWGSANPGTRQIFTTALFPDADKQVADEFNELQRVAISPQNAALLFEAIHTIDMREQAKQLTVPTLVMHSRLEEGVALEYGREMAALIPNARFVVLDSRNHIVLEHEPAYRRFLDEATAFIQS